MDIDDACIWMTHFLDRALMMHAYGY